MPVPVERLPQSEIAERMVLSALLKEYGWVMPKIGLSIEDFYFDRHRRVYLAIGEGATVETIWQRLRKDRTIFDGWRDLAIWLAEVYLLDPTGCSAEYHAATVKRLSVRRQIIHRANELIRDALNIAMSPREYEERLAKLMDV